MSCLPMVKQATAHVEEYVGFYLNHHVPVFIFKENN